MKKQAFLFSASEYLDSKCYPKPTLDLSCVKHDIQAMEVRLQQIGFSIIKKENVAKAEYLETINRHTEKSPSDAINILYFSGHGGHYNGNNYIFPSDFTSIFEATKSIQKSSINIEDIISAFKGKGYLIMILDACRSDIGVSKGYYSEMTSAENVYIAYGASFGDYSRASDNSPSWFTEAICDEILSADIDVDRLFTKVRQNIITKYQVQLPSSVNTLLQQVSLHTSSKYDSLDKQIYDFIEQYGDEYNEKHGYFKGEYLVFIDASQYFNISLLDTYWLYTKVQNKLSEEKGIKMPQLSEAEQKIITFMNLKKGKLSFDFDISHTWYYNGRQIRMGEIPPLPTSMQQKLPEPGKEIKLVLSPAKKDNVITFHTNLPNGCKIFLWHNELKTLKEYTVSTGKITITNATNIHKVVIDSSVFTNDETISIMLREKSRNLTGCWIKYNPIYGNFICGEFDFK